MKTGIFPCHAPLHTRLIDLPLPALFHVTLGGMVMDFPCIYCEVPFAVEHVLLLLSPHFFALSKCYCINRTCAIWFLSNN